jgi:uncharacterized protein
MRLTQYEIAAIKSIARRVFGSKTDVYLFGSRVDDLKKGGDIDLFIKGADEYSIRRKVLFLAELKKRIGDQKIDVVFDNENTRRQKTFYNSIVNNSAIL